VRGGIACAAALLERVFSFSLQLTLSPFSLSPLSHLAVCPENPVPKLNAFDGVGALAVFGEVGQLVHDASAGRLLIADLSAHLIRSLDLATNAVTTVSGNVTRSTNATGDGNPNAGSDDGLGAAVRYRQPYGLAIVGPGSAVVSDSLNNALRVLSLDSRGEAFTVAGAASVGGGDFVDGDGADARFWDPSGMASAPDGSVVVADAVNGAIRRVVCNFFPSPSASPAPPAPAPAASNNILGPVVIGGLRAGALAIIVVGVVAALGVAFALWWYCGGGRDAASFSASTSASKGALYTSSSPTASGQPGSPKAYGALDSGGGSSGEQGGSARAVANPYMAATAAAASAESGAAAPALPGGVQEWAPAPRARQPV
jgi:hypothetical protein